MKNPMDENEAKNVFDEQDFQPVDQTDSPDPQQNFPPSDPIFDKQPAPKKKKAWVVALAAVVCLLVFAAIAVVIYFVVDNTDNSDPEQPNTDDTPIEEIVLENNEYFVAEPLYEQVLYTPNGTYELEGDILDICEERALAAVKVTDLDVYNYDVDTVKIVDLLTGNVILEKSVKNLRNDPITNSITAEFCDECGVIAITEASITDLGLATRSINTVVYHYTAKMTPDLLGTTSNTEHECKDLGDVYAIGIDRKISFFDEDMNFISDENGDFLDVDDIPYLSADSFMVSETEGYFYFFTSKEALVFDMSGKCTAKYANDDVNSFSFSSMVLNNGKLFMQTLCFVESESEDYDFRIFNSPLKVKSYIMDNVTGNIQQVTCNFIVNKLSPAYESEPGDKGFPFCLKDGYQNQAYIVYFENGALNAYPEYVVLDNGLNVKYTFPRNGNAISYGDSFALDENHLVANVTLGGKTSQYQLLDINGNFISAFPKHFHGITESFIVSSQVIYDHNMKEVYNFASNGFSFVGITGDNVYLARLNEATEKIESYVYNNSSSEPTRAADGIEIIGYEEFSRNYSIVLDDRGWKTVYNYNGEVIAMSDGALDLTPVEGAIIVSATINGVIRNYVVHSSTAQK